MSDMMVVFYGAAAWSTVVNVSGYIVDVGSLRVRNSILLQSVKLQTRHRFPAFGQFPETRDGRECHAASRTTGKLQ